MAQSGLLMDTPYMLRLERVKKENYDLGLSKGLAEGEAKGLAEGEAKGLAEGEARGEARGLEEGKAKGLEEGKKLIRDSISALLSQRFDPRVKELTALQQQLQNLNSYGALSLALQKVALVESFADFAVWLREVQEEKATATAQNGLASASES